MTAREAAVAQALAWVGKPDAHAEIVELYNQQSPLPRGWKMRTEDDWCAATQSAIAVKLGYLEIMPGECSVGQMVELYKQLGHWVEDDSYVPMPGDLICYDWQDNGVGDNMGWPDHIGMVVKVGGRQLTVVEGNMVGNVVGTRDIKVNDRFIRGYCCPDYESMDGSVYDPIQAEINAMPDWSRPTIQMLYDAGALQGDGRSLDLSYDLTRTLVTLDRMGMFNLKFK